MGSNIRGPARALQLTAVLLVSLACASARPLAPATLTPLASDVWLHTSYRDVAGFGRVASNGLVIRTPDGIVLVDTAWTDADTERVLELARQATGAPVSAAVATHAHADKMGGMGAVRAAGIRSYAHPRSNLDAPTRGLLPASESLFAGGEAEQSVAGVEVFYPGAGHARDNVVVYFAAARVLFGGCLIRPGDASDLGNTADGDVANWASAVRAAAARFSDARTVVPSHGAPGGRELLEHTIALAEAATRR